MTPQPVRRSGRKKKPRHPSTMEDNMSGTTGARSRSASATPKQTLASATSSSIRRPKKTISSGGTTTSNQLVLKRKAPTADYWNAQSKTMVVRSFAMTNSDFRRMGFVAISREPGYRHMNPDDPIVRRTSSTAFQKQRNTDEGRKRALQTLKTATALPPLHPDLDVNLFTSQDGNVIGVPALGGVETMSFYTTEGAAVVDPAHLQQLEAEREAPAVAAAATAAAVVANIGAPPPRPVNVPSGPNPPAATGVTAELQEATLVVNNSADKGFELANKGIELSNSANANCAKIAATVGVSGTVAQQGKTLNEHGRQLAEHGARHNNADAEIHDLKVKKAEQDNIIKDLKDQVQLLTAGRRLLLLRSGHE